MKLLFKKVELILELISQEMMYSNFSILIRKKVRFESTSKDSFPSLSSAASTSTSNAFPSLSSAARTKDSPPLPKKKGETGFVKIAKGDVVSDRTVPC